MTEARITKVQEYITYTAYQRTDYRLHNTVSIDNFLPLLLKLALCVTMS